MELEEVRLQCLKLTEELKLLNKFGVDRTAAQIIDQAKILENYILETGDKPSKKKVSFFEKNGN